MANKWFEYPKKKPKKDGWYQCTVGAKVPEHYDVMDLYYYTETGEWCDERRQIVFNVYEVYGQCEGPDGVTALEHIYKDDYCVRDDVIAWKNLPKPYR